MACFTILFLCTAFKYCIELVSRPSESTSSFIDTVWPVESEILPNESQIGRISSLKSLSSFSRKTNDAAASEAIFTNCSFLGSAGNSW